MTNYRDALTGQFTTAADAALRPAETVSETVPTRHETPDVAELRRLLEEFRAVTPGRATAAPFSALMDALLTHADALLDAADRLAHMREARDNARAEVERLAALLAEADEPHPDRPNCTTVGGKGVRVTATDLETGESESVVIDDNYVLICAGDRYQSEVQRHANGTTVLTVKVRKHLAALDGGSES